MCGRFSLVSSREEVSAFFSAFIDHNFPPRQNISPTQPVLAIGARDTGLAEDDYRYKAALVRWGFIPAFVKDLNNWPLTINIRRETIAEKKSFRNALHYRRVIIPANGFYEWKKKTNAKSQPFFIEAISQPLLGFAGLMEVWSDKTGSELDTVAIITTAATEELRNIHPRMPVVIDQQDQAAWLNCRDFRPKDVLALLDKPRTAFFRSTAIYGTISDRVLQHSTQHTRQADGQIPQTVPQNDQLSLFDN